jgi:DNA-binding CsgD family transcriptional regulator
LWKILEPSLPQLSVVRYRPQRCTARPNREAGGAAPASFGKHPLKPAFFGAFPAFRNGSKDPLSGVRNGIAFLHKSTTIAKSCGNNCFRSTAIIPTKWQGECYESWKQSKLGSIFFCWNFFLEGDLMREQSVRLGPREQQIVELLLQGCDNAEIARQLNMARRTVKAHFNRLFLRFGITGGIKRVKLATLLYRRQTCQQMNAMDPVPPANVSSESSNLSLKA